MIAFYYSTYIVHPGHITLMEICGEIFSVVNLPVSVIHEGQFSDTDGSMSKRYKNISAVSNSKKLSMMIHVPTKSSSC